MTTTPIQDELRSIRTLMDRSTKFLSLNGLSGVTAGIYALLGAYFAHKILDNNDQIRIQEGPFTGYPAIAIPLFWLGLAVLFLSVITGFWINIQESKKNGDVFWNPVSRRFLSGLAIPIITGGIFVLILIWQHSFNYIAASCLLFYGLALANAGQFTFSEIRWLGFLMIVLGLLAAIKPALGLTCWTVGFGILHLLYGVIMYLKYNR